MAFKYNLELIAKVGLFSISLDWSKTDLVIFYHLAHFFNSVLDYITIMTNNLIKYNIGKILSDPHTFRKLSQNITK